MCPRVADQEEAGRVFQCLANLYARGILRMKVHDATAGFKCWTRHALETIQLERVRSNGYVFQVEMAYLCQKLNLRVVEIPIYFEDRRIGHSKMSIPVRWRPRGAHGKWLWHRKSNTI
jgi:dolichol-phosphate mannosyltransferase